MIVKRVADAMERIAPVKLAEAWDNVGLLLESIPRPGKQRILLTIDLSAGVFSEALSVGASVVVAYHPPWFSAAKRLTFAPEAGIMSVVAQCAAHGISLYSPHTALDVVAGGTNDHVIDLVFGPGAIRAPLQPLAASIRSDFPATHGLGRLVTLGSPTDLAAVVSAWKRASGVSVVRVVPGTRPIRTVAVCVGSGASLFRAVDADLFLTGEMSHHEMVHAAHRGSSVLLTEHSVGERVFLAAVLRPMLEKELGDDVEVVVSSVDADPVHFH